MRMRSLVVVRLLTIGLTLLSVAAGMAAWAQDAARDPDAIVESVKKWRERNPVVEALTGGDADTPAEWFQVAVILADQDRPDLAKQYLGKVLSAKLDAAGLVALADRFGTSAFARLAARSELSPEAGKLADAVLAAVKQERHSPEHLAELVKQLASSNERTRDEAIVGLREAGPAAVAPLVAALVDPARAAEHGRLRAVLASLGADATRPLLAYLEASDPKFVAQVIGAVAQMDDRDSALYLLSPYASAESDPVVRQAAATALARRVNRLPTPADAAKILAQRARRYLDGEATVREDENGRTVVWSWDPEKRQAVAKTYSAAAARAVLAARLAREALAVAPTDAEVRRLYLLATLEAASYEAGLDEPLSTAPGTPAARAAEFSAAELLAALDEALSTGHALAATAAARILGQTATADKALNVGATDSPLARALRSADRRTRMAAVEAIVRLRPTQSFAGSSYLSESMAFLASSTGARRALVAAGNPTEARRVGGYLSGLGYEVETAATGREMIQKLCESADYELVLVEARIDNPPIGVLLQQLRRDGRTASLPVGVLGDEGSYDVADRAVRDDPMALSIVRPHDEQTVRWQVERLEKLSAPSAVSPERRRRQAAEVLGQLAGLMTTTSPGVFNLEQIQQAVLRAARSPEMSAGAIGVLEKLSTPESQKTLVDLAGDARQPVELRKSALAALTKSVKQHGILLTTDEILEQYARYNRSATADRATQEILGAILDCFEAGSGQ